jgi:phosphate transport system substrate-binding protein
MRHIASIILLILLILANGCSSRHQTSEEAILMGEAKARLSISGAFALYPLTVLWAEEFQKTHPNIRIDISAGGAGKGMADVLSEMVDIGMFSRELSPEELKQGATFFAVAKDAVIPTINSRHPQLNTLKSRGISMEEFRRIFVTGEIASWSELGLGGEPAPINVYTRSDACGAAAMWGAWLGVSQEDLLGTGVFGDPGIADAVKADPLGLGYNNVIYVYDIQTRKKYEGMEVLPIDLNGNGKVEYGEAFYEHLDTLMVAIKQGDYPSPPARNLYLIIKGRPENPATRLFLAWVLDKGQNFVKQAGYVALDKDQVSREMEKLTYTAQRGQQ